MNETLLLDWDSVNVTFDDSLENDLSARSRTNIVVAVLYGLIVLFALVGNIVIISTVCARKSMKTAANYLIVNIALADILTAVVCMPEYPIRLFQWTWVFNNFSCKLFVMVGYASLSIVQISLVALSIVWFKVIVCPSQLSLNKREGVLICITICVVSFFVAIPNWMYSRIETLSLEAYCVHYWPNSQHAQAVYLLFYTIWTYFFPIVWFIGTYIIISDKLFRTYNLVGRSTVDLDGLKNTKESVKMVMVVTAVQLVCWGPFSVTQVGSMFIYEMFLSENTFIIINALAFSSLLWKPIIYLTMSAKFRTNVKKTFRWCPCVQFDDY